VRRLRTIVIEGFKTFAHPTVVDLAEGMTAVVGPNGCGKSNLVDAIAWAVGSRSWKSLRGSEMEDVIFHGSETAPQASRAVVRLVFGNSDRALPIDLEDVEVSREIDRTSGSRSFINRVEARVKDLQSLLAGTGLVGGFSLIRQGSVDRLILSPPEELGRWIEEAANIASFRSKRREALDRLDRVRQNLVQAEGHVERLRRDLRKVKDRAAKARERKALENRAALLSSHLARLERQAIEEELASLEARQGNLPEEEADLGRLREALLALRIGLEEELAGEGAARADASQAEAPTISPEIATHKSGQLLSTASFLAEQSRLLDREGPAAWGKVKAHLHRAIEMIREIQADSPHQETLHRETRSITPAQGLRQTLREIDALDTRRAAITRELAAIAAERARLDERLAHLGAPETPPADSLPTSGLAGLRDEIGLVQKELAKIGPVDETAADLETELVHKVEVAKASLKDLREAQGTLLRFLEELDVLTAQVFRSTLIKVEQRFLKYFVILFGGGKVRLRLRPKGKGGDREEGALPDLRDESHAVPVEIYVKLPGKGESGLTLLSGGEKSLTGIALVLALAAGNSEKGNEGRLLIMDEVDAALDQANAGRFARLVAQLSKTHQVLCVTHNTLTAQEAARLIGVTSGGVAAGTSVVLETNLPQQQIPWPTAPGDANIFQDASVE
jgi:chromosome segregation ATPase